MTATARFRSIWECIANRESLIENCIFLVHIETALSAEYGIVLFKGMKETYPDMTDEETFDYLKACGEERQ